MPEPHIPILFFDGECAFCSRSVRWLSRIDRDYRLYYAPLQGETAKALLPDEYCQQIGTAVFRLVDLQTDDPKLHTRSDAVLMAAITTGTCWRFPARIFLWISVCIRDGIYNWVARNRHRLFGSASCSLEHTIAEGHQLP